MIECAAISGSDRSSLPKPSVLQLTIIKHMNSLSKDAVNWLAVGEDGVGQRVDNYLVKILKGVPKSHIYRILRSGEVRREQAPGGARHPALRGRPSPRPPNPGRPLRCASPVPRAREPGGAAADPVRGRHAHRFEQARGSRRPWRQRHLLRRHRAPAQARPEASFLELVHRLDRDTSGVLIVAKKRRALTGLHAQAEGRARSTSATTCLVRGRWRDALRAVELALTSYVTDDGERRVRVDAAGRLARTIFRRTKVWPDADPPVALLEAELETGRTHQIRVHLAHLGFPLAGDDKYGDFAWNRTLARQGLKRMFLHAPPHPLRASDRRPGGSSSRHPLPPELAAFVARLDGINDA